MKCVIRTGSLYPLIISEFLCAARIRRSPSFLLGDISKTLENKRS